MFNNEFSSVIIDDLFSLNYLYIFLLGSVCTAYAFMASVYLLKFISPYSLVLTYNLEPIYGIILALIFFGDNEKMSLPFYIGFFLILFSVLGLFLLCSSNDLITAYLAIELQSLSFYVLAAFKKNSSFSVDAGVKYFIIGALSSSLFLFGSS